MYIVYNMYIYYKLLQSVYHCRTINLMLHSTGLHCVNIPGDDRLQINDLRAACCDCRTAPVLQMRCCARPHRRSLLLLLVLQQPRALSMETIEISNVDPLWFILWATIWMMLIDFEGVTSFWKLRWMIHYPSISINIRQCPQQKHVLLKSKHEAAGIIALCLACRRPTWEPQPKSVTLATHNIAEEQLTDERPESAAWTTPSA